MGTNAAVIFSSSTSVCAHMCDPGQYETRQFTAHKVVLVQHLHDS